MQGSVFPRLPRQGLFQAFPFQPRALCFFRVFLFPLSGCQAEEEGNQEDRQQGGRNDAAQHPRAYGALRARRRPVGEGQRNTPAPNAREVIRMGLRRSLAAATAASITSMPSR